MSRGSAAMVAALAVLGLVASAGIGLLANTVSGDSIGLAAAPLSAGRQLAPPEARDRHRGRDHAEDDGRHHEDRSHHGSDDQPATTTTVPTTTTAATTTPTTTLAEPGDDNGGGFQVDNSGPGSSSSGSGSSGSGSSGSGSSGSDD